MDGTKVLSFALSSSYPRTTGAKSYRGLIKRSSRGRRLQQSLHRDCFLELLMGHSNWITLMSLASLSSPQVQHFTFSSSSGACAHKQSFKKQMSSQFPRTTRPTQKTLPAHPMQGPTRPKPGPARPKLGLSQISGDLEIWELRINKKTQSRNSQHPNSFCPTCPQGLDQ